MSWKSKVRADVWHAFQTDRLQRRRMNNVEKRDHHGNAVRFNRIAVRHHRLDMEGRLIEIKDPAHFNTVVSDLRSNAGYGNNGIRLNGGHSVNAFLQNGSIYHLVHNPALHTNNLIDFAFVVNRSRKRVKAFYAHYPEGYGKMRYYVYFSQHGSGDLWSDGFTPV